MANETEKRRFELMAENDLTASDYENELVALFCNAPAIDNITNPDADPVFIIKALLTKGECGKYKNEFYKLIPSAPLDRYGRPAFYDLVTGNGLTPYHHIPRAEIAVLRANAVRFPYISVFKRVAEQMASIDASIKTNVYNSLTAWLLAVEDEKTAETIRRAYSDILIGMPAVIVNKRTIGDTFADAKNVSVPFIADRLQTLKMAIWEDALKRCGVVASNGFKRERVQTAEVNAGAGESIDYIYTMIDTFNKDAERAGIPERMRFNGVAQEYDRTETTEREGENNEI